MKLVMQGVAEWATRALLILVLYLDVFSKKILLIFRSQFCCLRVYYNFSKICLSLFAVYRPQFLLDRLGRYLKLFVSTVIPFFHAFKSQFGLLANFS